MTNEPMTRGAHHVGLTVADLEAARRFFVDGLGFREVGAKPDYPAIFVSDGVTMVTLWRAADPARAVAFDRRNAIGLHHLALRVAPGDLDVLYARLSATPGITIEFAPEPLGGGPTRHMMCAMPGGIRIELLAPGSREA